MPPSGPALAASLALLSALACRPPEATQPVTVIKRPRSGTLLRTLRVSGTIGAARAATLAAPALAGVRRDRNEQSLTLQTLAPSGEPVRSGELIATFDPQWMDLRIDDYASDIAQRQDIVKRLIANLDIRRAALNQRLHVAQANLDKALLNLKTSPVRSAIQAERYRLQRDEAQAEARELTEQLRLFEISERASLRREEIQLRQQELELQRAQRNRDRMSVRAPLAGIIIPGTIQRGADQAEIRAGDEVRPGHAFLRVLDMSGAILDAVVNQADAHLIHAGAEATVFFDALPGHSVPGRVTALGGIAASSRYRPEWVKYLAIRILVRNPGPSVAPNFSASADIVLAREQAAVIVPRECVYPGDPPYCLRRSGPSWQRQPVQTGLANHVETVILDGLDPAAELACAPWRD